MGHDRTLVLVVDDDEDICGALEEALTLLGFRVATAGHGAAALEWLEHARELPAAILLDIMMPVMDGIQLGHELRADPRFASIPVIVLTARADADAIAAELHAKRVVRKPIQLLTLKNVITDVVTA
ncbi:MAG TPA: response regulator [Kofleriaceae bacterium]|nr:response regulator [Kofleriaceae bacterium]